MESVKKNFMSAQSFAPMIAGFSGGVASTTLLLPLDLIRVRMQVNEEPRRSRSDRGSSRRSRMGSMGILRGIIRHEGIMGLYQGWTPAVVGSAVSWGGYFFIYEALKKSLAEQRKQKQQQHTNNSERPSVALLSSWDYFVLSVGSGGAMVFLTNPIWLIKTRMQLQMKHSSKQHKNVKAPYNGLVDAVRTIIKEEGALALYKGTGPALLLTSHGGVQFVVYEFLKKRFRFTRAERSAEINKAKSVLKRLEDSFGFLTMGTVSKIIASTVTYPLQVIKARLQQRSESLELTSEGKLQAVKRNYSGLANTVLKIVKQEGVTGLFKGCVPNAIRAAPNAAITFVVYEGVMDLIA